MIHLFEYPLVTNKTDTKKRTTINISYHYCYSTSPFLIHKKATYYIWCLTQQGPNKK